MKIILNQVQNAKKSLSVFAPGNQLTQEKYSLINDLDNPGSYKSYSTNENGIKGWYDYPFNLFTATKWTYGEDYPLDSNGNDKDFYLKTSDNSIYCKDKILSEVINLSTSSISVSSFLDDDAATYDTDFMIDGNTSTFWASNSDSQQTVTFDFGASNEKLLDEINFSWQVSETLSNYRIDIFGSNDGNDFAFIQELYTGNELIANNNLIFDTDNFVKYRFIQLKFSHEDDILTNHFSVYEIELYKREFSWQKITTLDSDKAWEIIVSDISAISGKKYAFNTTDNQIELTLPTNPDVNDKIYFNDALKNFANNPVTITQSSGDLIQGSASSYILNESGISGEIVFVGDIIGWMIVT